MSAIIGGSPVSASSEPDDSLTQSSTPGANGKIAFASTQFIRDIYVMNADGSSQINLTNNPGGDGEPAWSPDGTKIAFTSSRDGNAEIYVMNADGSNQTRLTNNPGADGEPAWSPDGARIAFSTFFTRADGVILPNEIYVMNADGSSQANLTNSPAVSDGEPAWSTDGRIAFTSDRDTSGGNLEIYVMNADGGNPTRLTNNPADDFSPAWSRDGTRIAFTSDRDTSGGNLEIYVMNADGSNQTNLTNSPPRDFDPAWNDFDPAWSPDGTRITFASDRHNFDLDPAIYVMNADGSNQTRLTNETDFQPAWSPDGARIAFTRFRIINAEIFVVNADGSNQTNLTNNPASDSDPDWSADGARIAFTRNGEIYVMNADGSNQTRLTNHPADDSDPAWSPDGTRIAFTSGSGRNDDDIYVMNADGSNRTRLTNNPANDSNPAWSPDGTRIAFTSRRDGNDEIYVMNADGSSQINLTNNPGWDESPAWSPDGTRIAFASDRDGNLEIYVMNADGGNQANLTNSPDGSDGGPTLSHDGARIAFASDRDGNLEIYVMNADGSNQTRLVNNPGASDVDPDWQALPATPTSTVQFSAAGYSVSEGAGSLPITVTRTGDTTSAASVNYASSDTAGPNNCNVFNGAASSRCDYATAVGALRFAAGESIKTISLSVVDDAYVEGNETLQLTLSNAVGASLGGQSTATVSINDNDTVPSSANPIDSSRFFVRKHYLDFLNREPDQGGWDYWTARITGCGNDALCVHQRRIDVSAAFFVEPEFQETGYVVHRLHRAAYGGIIRLCFGPEEFQCDETCSAPCEREDIDIANVTHSQFVTDRAQLVGGPGLPQSTINFANNFVQRPEFRQAYPEAMTPSDFVNKLFDTANLTGSANASLRQAAIDALTNGSQTRAQALLDVIEISEFKTRQYNPAFVLMQYFGYLRRDVDLLGYDFWLDVVNNRAPNNYRAMVCAFLTSAEYQLRFGASVTRTNQDCAR